MKVKSITAAILTIGLLAGCFVSNEVQAMSRENIAKIKVSKSGNFKYWQKDAQSLKALKIYVKDVTNKKSDKYVPEADRIAVFDMDGTLIAERAPFYAEWMMHIKYVKENPDKVSELDKKICAEAEQAIANGSVTAELDEARGQSQSRVFANVTSEQFQKTFRGLLDSPMEQMTMKYGESFYLPMAEVISYLKAHKFKVYICSGADRDIVRAMVGGVLPIAPENIIGKDAGHYALKQGSIDPLNYTFGRNGDELLRDSGKVENVKFYKVQHIAREIGRAPILAWGNSSGDLAMYNYTLNNPQYKGIAFSLMCDDLERDYGSTKVAERMKTYCDENGYVAVSMRDDWKTIYGYDVEKVQQSN